MSFPNFIYLQYFLLYFFCYLGLGSYFVSLSPYIIEKFGDLGKYIFFSGQIGYPLGYLFSGWISDKTKKIKIFGIFFSLLLIPAQYFLYDPSLDFNLTIFYSFLIRFLFASNIQILQIAALEQLYYSGFSISRAAGTLGFLFTQTIMFLLELYYFNSDNNLIEASRGGQLGSWIHILTLMLAFIVLPENRKSKSHFYFKDVTKLIFSSSIWMFFIISFFYYFSYQIVDFYLGSYFIQLGGMKYVYLSWILSVIIEIPFFPLTQKIIYKWNLKYLFIVSLMAGSLRFLFLIINVYYLSGKWILITQLLHGIHFTGYMAGSIYFFHKKFPEHLYGTAFGLFVIFSLSIGSILGTFFYGILLEKYNYGILFFVSLIVHFILFIIKIFYKKIDKLFL